ncbi:GNAT family N-acetyltransferase [Chitinophaga defluvii]|uniref:GNAT family N-acetyltransferase n=1 Tax=Chitinophaga defluvii TaxID=3163343 RepID=A0ABV2TC23_9BACT
MNWVIKTFEELTIAELYAILHLRSEVFVVEQHCNYQDMDYADQQAIHVQGYTEQGNLGVYTRVFAAGVKFDEASIGRVVSAAAVRGTGAGRLLMQKSIAVLEELYGKVPIRIGAQLYLKKFYESLGFEQKSGIYLEDNIEHIEMVRAGAV